jgi:cobalt-zinc-cadmium efflux system membrane fusion protein
MTNAPMTNAPIANATMTNLRLPSAASFPVPVMTIMTTIMFAAIFFFCGGCSSKTGDKPPASSVTTGNVKLTAAQRANIHLYTVEPAAFRKTIEANGAVDFDNDQATSVLAPFSGPVSRLLVALGAKVKKGDPLAEVASPDFAAAIDTYRKSLATAKTLRRLADLDLDLVQHHGVAQRESDQAQTDAFNAEADRDAALQALVSLNVPPQTVKDIQEGRPVSRPEAIIRSPVAGTVVEKLITPGELLQAGSTACFTVADLSRVWVLAQIFDADLREVSLGDTAEVITGIGSTPLTGTVDNISALVDPDTRSVAARVVVKNPAEILKKQMYVHVRLQSREQRNALLVPVSAILRDDENLPFVYVAQRDMSFARRHVSLGYRAADQYEITAGLDAGDEIVVEGGIFLQFMQAQ